MIVVIVVVINAGSYLVPFTDRCHFTDEERCKRKGLISERKSMGNSITVLRAEA